MSFLFFVLWPILVAFMHFAQEIVGHYLQQSLGLSTFSSFSSLPSLPARFQVVLCVFGLWSVVQSFLLILSFDQAKQQHSVTSFQTNNPHPPNFPIFQVVSIFSQTSLLFLKAAKEHQNMFSLSSRPPHKTWCMLVLQWLYDHVTLHFRSRMIWCSISCRWQVSLRYLFLRTPVQDYCWLLEELGGFVSLMHVCFVNEAESLAFVRVSEGLGWG